MDDYRKIKEGLLESWMELRLHPHKETEGVDRESIISYSRNFQENLKELAKKLEMNSFSFDVLKRATIVQKGKEREILIQTVNDRIVTKSILKVINPYFDVLNSNCDFSRKVEYKIDNNKFKYNGIPLAAKLIQQYLKEGYIWVFEADIKKFFDHVPKQRIMKIIEGKILNHNLLELIRSIIYFRVEKSVKKDAKQYSDTNGIAQGSPLSPLLASIYLYELDMCIKKYENVRLIRYVDDFIVLCTTQETAQMMYELIRRKMKEMELEIHDINIADKNGLIKTKITKAKGYGANAFEFLGLSFNFTDIDIGRRKKEDIKTDLEEILKDGSTNLLEKIKKTQTKLVGYIRQYKREHYSRTVASLTKIISFSQESLKKYYRNQYKKITGKDHLNKLNTRQINNVFKFLGIDFQNLLKK